MPGWGASPTFVSSEMKPVYVLQNLKHNNILYSFSASVCHMDPYELLLKWRKTMDNVEAMSQGVEKCDWIIGHRIVKVKITNILRKFYSLKMLIIENLDWLTQCNKIK